MLDASQVMPMFTLLVALVAAIGGPIVALRLGKRQSVDAQHIANLQAEVQRRVANHQIVAPMRQAWINSLRDLLSEIFSRADTFRLKDVNKRTLEELGSIATLENKLRLLINPLESDHRELIDRVRAMLAQVETGHGHPAYFQEKDKVFQLAQGVLKAEWNRTKSDSA